ncbi:hypothetical protein KSF78_0000234 [Schistosoma japonicum]|nr:hypothetical protein KSF78_0000234 [Schistosoma japonicum]
MPLKVTVLIFAIAVNYLNVVYCDGDAAAPPADQPTAAAPAAAPETPAPDAATTASPAAQPTTPKKAQRPRHPPRSPPQRRFLSNLAFGCILIFLFDGG